MAPPADRLTLGGDLVVNRSRYGAMQLTGRGVWGEYPDRDSAIALLRHVVDAGVTFIDTADAYGPHTNETLIHDALWPYPAWLLHRSPVMLPIAGTSNREHFYSNLAATNMHLTDDEVRTITNLVPDPESNTLG